MKKPTTFDLKNHKLRGLIFFKDLEMKAWINKEGEGRDPVMNT